MTARIVRANYDDLAKAAGIFGQQAALTESTLQDLRQQLETLRGGDWLGQGANAFYSEMDSQVVPSVGRLIRALGQAADTTRQISQIVHEAEYQAAAVFKSTGAAAAGTASGGAAVGSPAGASASAFLGPMAGPNGGGGGSGASAPNTITDSEKRMLDELSRLDDDDPKSPAVHMEMYDAVVQDQPLRQHLGRLGKAGWRFEKGRAGDVAIDYRHQVITLGPKANFHSLTQAVHKIWNDPAILHNSGLDPAVVAQIRKDPILLGEIRQLGEQSPSWTIVRNANPGTSTFALGGRKMTITPDPKRQLAKLREFVRNAIRGPGDEAEPRPGMSQSDWSQWVHDNAEYRLTNEANEMLAKYQAYHDVYDKIMPVEQATGFPTNQPDKYAQIFSDYLDGKMGPELAAAKLAQVMNADPNSSAELYRKYYEAMLPPGVYTPWNK